MGFGFVVRDYGMHMLQYWECKNGNSWCDGRRPTYLNHRRRLLQTLQRVDTASSAWINKIHARIEMRKAEESQSRVARDLRYDKAKKAAHVAVACEHMKG